MLTFAHCWEWAVRNSRGEVHFARTAEDAVRLMVALKKAEAEVK